MPATPAEAPQIDPSNEQMTALQSAEAQDTPVADAKQMDRESVRTSFVDSLGRTREAHPGSAEIVVTDEIADSLFESFRELDGSLTQIDEDLSNAEWQISHPDEYARGAYNPLDDAFLERVKETVREQLGRITREEQFTDTVRTAKKGLFGTKTTEKQVESTRQILIDGFVHELDPQTVSSLNFPIHYQRYTTDPRTGKIIPKDQVLAVEAAKATRIAEELLLSEEKRLGDYGSNPRLPLLASRIFQDGADLDQLTFEKLQSLVPELQPLFDNIETSRGVISKEDTSALLESIAIRLMEMGPRSDLLSTIFYNDADIQGILQRYQRTQSLENLVWQRNVHAWKQLDDFEQEMTAEIEHFFDDKVTADTLVFHGTPALPRIIDSGKLMPAHLMNREGREFTYFTRRNDSGQIDGTRGVHWAGIHGETYITDGVQTLEGYVTDRELAKGALAGGVVAIRIGDALKQAPFIEGPEISSDDRRELRRQSVSSAVVELTEAGYEKIKSKLQETLPSVDTVFTAAAGGSTNDEIFNYSFPLDDLLIEVNRDEAEPVLSRLEQAGWSKQDIVDRVTYIDRGSDPRQQKRIADGELARRVKEHPKYPRAFVAGLHEFNF